MKVIYEIIGILMWIIIFAALFTAYHEQVHKQIYSSYGIESEINYNFLKSTTMPVNLSEGYKCNQNCQSLHDLNEIISYPLQVFLVLLSVISYIKLREFIKEYGS